MATIIDNVYQSKEITQNKRTVVELVGVAGVGKTTLCKTIINKKLPWIIYDDVPTVWKMSSVGFYFKNLFSMAPLLLQLQRKGGRLFKRRELAFLSILNGWHKVLQNKLDYTNKVLVLDQGPISIIAYLNTWGPRNLFTPAMDMWWESVYENYSHAVDMVILMDTSDEIIINRINTRPQGHHLKGEPEKITLSWIRRYRELYDHIIGRLTNINHHTIRVVRINSGQYSPNEIAEQVLQEFSLANGGVSL